MPRLVDPIRLEMRAFFDANARSLIAAVNGHDDGMRHYLGLRPRVLSRAFNRLRLPSREHDQPARRFATRHGFKDIAGDWRLPQGLRAQDVEAYILCLRWALRFAQLPPADYIARQERLLDRLFTLNPQLRRLRFDRKDTRKGFDLVMGVTSGFNTDDIQHFIDGKVGYISRQDPAYARQSDRIERIFGHMEWVPAPVTMAKIEAQIPARFKRKF